MSTERDPTGHVAPDAPESASEAPEASSTARETPQKFVWPTFPVRQVFGVHKFSVEEYRRLQHGMYERPNKTFTQAAIDNPLVVLGASAMVGSMIQGMRNSLRGNELEANRWMVYKNWASVSTVAIILFSGFVRNVRWRLALEDFMKDQETLYSKLDALSDASESETAVSNTIKHDSTSPSTEE